MCSDDVTVQQPVECCLTAFSVHLVTVTAVLTDVTRRLSVYTASVCWVAASVDQVRLSSTPSAVTLVALDTIIVLACLLASVSCRIYLRAMH